MSNTSATNDRDETFATSMKKRSIENSYNIDNFALLLEFQTSKRSLQISASQVASLTGFNPYSNIPELFVELVYQGYAGKLLFEHDCSLLDLRFLSKEESIQTLARKGGNELCDVLQQSLFPIVADDDDKNKKTTAVVVPDTIQEVHQVKETIMQAMKKSKTLTAVERTQLYNHTKFHLHTTFGQTHEDSALDEYEKQCGYSIRQRNAETKCWNFIREQDLIQMRGVSASPFSNKNSIWTVLHSDLSKTTDDLSMNRILSTSSLFSSQWMSTTDGHVSLEYGQQSNLLCMGSSSENAIDIDDDAHLVDLTLQIPPSHENNNKKKKKKNWFALQPFFSILGSIDGIRDEYYKVPKKCTNLTSADTMIHDNLTANESTNEFDWEKRPLIVECKHRMKRLFFPPPLYDIIQCVVYCHMYCTEEGEIVQVLRQHDKENEQNKNRPSASDMAELPWVDWNVNKSSTKHSVDSDIDNGSKFKLYSTRISLNDPKTQHQKNFFEVILPRLEIFVQAVYKIRADDSMRYRMLYSWAASSSEDGSDHEMWDLLFSLCPYFVDCDTEYHRSKRYKEIKIKKNKESCHQ